MRGLMGNAWLSGAVQLSWRSRDYYLTIDYVDGRLFGLYAAFECSFLSMVVVVVEESEGSGSTAFDSSTCGCGLRFS